MILRRFMKHVTDQNWFAVGLDVIVVIVGIFLGLQVQAWYEGRQDRALEQQYLRQMQVEVRAAVDRWQEPVALVSQVSALHREIMETVRETGAFPVLSETHCNAIVMSHIYSNFIQTINSIEELEATGRTTLITSDNIRALLSNYKRTKEANDRTSNQMMLTAKALSETFADLIETSDIYRGARTIGLETGHKCHSDLMSKDMLFRNQLWGNVSKYSSYNITINAQLDALRQLAQAIDEELDLT